MGKSRIPHGLVNYQHKDQYGKLLGYRITKFNRKTWEAFAEIALDERHLSPAGRVHGGVISGFVDVVCGAAVFSTLGPKDFCSTVELKVNYFRPLDAGDYLKAHARVKFRGNRVCVVLAEVFRGSEKDAVAMATATFNVVTPAGSQPPAPIR